jgi:CBS domain-containing protein
MAARGFTAAPVIDQAGRPVGVISRTDILIHRGEKAPGAAESAVRDLMTPAVFSVTPQTPADQVVEQLVAMHVHQLFVVDEDQLLIGVVTAHDVLRRLRR